MLVGYARVSTKEQNLDRQLKELSEAGIEKLFTEQQSGKNVTDRSAFNEMLNFVRQGDTVVVSSLDRLGRNYADIKETVSTLSRKNVNIEILDAEFLNFNTGNPTLDKAMRDMFLSLLSYIAQNEREKTLERQKQGIAIAKEKGVYQGKPLEYSPNAKDKKKRAIYFNIVEDLKAGQPITSIRDKYGVSRNLIYRIRKDIQQEQEQAQNV